MKRVAAITIALALACGSALAQFRSDQELDKMIAVIPQSYPGIAHGPAEQSRTACEWTGGQIARWATLRKMQGTKPNEQAAHNLIDDDVLGHRLAPKDALISHAAVRYVAQLPADQVQADALQRKFVLACRYDLER